MNYRYMAEILYLIDKKNIFFMCKLKSYLYKNKPYLLLEVDNNEEVLKNYLCCKRGIVNGK